MLTLSIIICTIYNLPFWLSLLDAYILTAFCFGYEVKIIHLDAEDRQCMVVIICKLLVDIDGRQQQENKRMLLVTRRSFLHTLESNVVFFPCFMVL